MKRIFLSFLCIVFLISGSAFAKNTSIEKETIQILITKSDQNKPVNRSITPLICDVEYDRIKKEVMVRMLIDDGMTTIKIADRRGCIVQTLQFNISEQTSVILSLPEVSGELEIEIHTNHFRGIGFFNLPIEG